MKIQIFAILLISLKLNANELNYDTLYEEENTYNFGIYANLLGPELGLSIEPSLFLFNCINLYFRFGGRIAEAGGNSDSLTLRRTYTLGLNYFYNFDKNNSILVGPGLLKSKDEIGDSFSILYLSVSYEYTLNSGFAFKLGASSYIKPKPSITIPSISIAYKF